MLMIENEVDNQIGGVAIKIGRNRAKRLLEVEHSEGHKMMTGE